VTLALVPDPLPVSDGDCVAQDDGRFLLRLVALERRIVGTVLHSTLCEVAFSGSQRLLALTEIEVLLERDDLLTQEFGQRVVTLTAKSGMVRVFTCTETCQGVVVAVRRTASVLLSDGTWMPARVTNSIGPYLVVRWNGGLAMLT
jgi:hypothetical protein